jgi:Flp pilus assembly protein TadG
MRHPALPAVNPHRSRSHQSVSRKPLEFGLRALWRRCAGESGTSLVEFTVSVPVLFMLLLGFVQMCVAVYSSFCVNEIARDSARWAAVRGSNSCADAPGLAGCNATSASIKSFAKSTGYPGIDPSKISVSTSWLQATADTPVTWSACSSGTSAICNAPGNAVQVAVRYPFPFQIPFAGNSTFNFSSTAQLVIVQ